MTNAAPSDIQSTLDAWREQGSDRLDPVHFQLIQAMANRAVNLDGHARQVLDTRLAELTQQYRTRLDSDANTATPNALSSKAPQVDTLSSLLNHLTALAAPDTTRAFASSVGNLRERYPELPVLDEFRSTWSRVSANRQVRQSEEQVHENAGPLNSNHLVHRTLSMMRDVSPGYLHQFLSYLDALAWVEQLQMGSMPPAKETARGAGKSARKNTTKNTIKNTANKTRKKPA